MNAERKPLDAMAVSTMVLLPRVHFRKFELCSRAVRDKGADRNAPRKGNSIGRAAVSWVRVGKGAR